MVIHNAILTGSISMQAPPVISGSLTLTGSITSTGPITGSGFFTAGTITAQTLVVQTITSSVSSITGSTKFGSIIGNTHQFTGSVLVSGSGTFNGVLTATDGTQGLNVRAYTGGAGFGAIYSTGVTAGAGNFALAASPTQTILSGVDSVNLAINSAIKLAISSSGNVGIGTASPESVTNFNTLQVDGTSGAMLRTGTSAYGGYVATIATADVMVLSNVRNPINGTFSNTGKAASVISLYGESGNGYITFSTTNSNNTGPAERMRITSTGLVGIGTTNPVTNLEVSGSIGATGLRYSSSPTKQGVYLGNSAATPGTTDYATIEMCGGATGGCEIDFTKPGFDFRGRIGYDMSTDYMWFVTAASERMRITSGGVIFINRTASWTTFGDSGGASISSDANGSTYYAVYDGGESLGLSRRGTDGTIALFRRATTTVGTISVTASATAYNTSSDYRLKQDLKDFNGLNIISSIKMYDFKWKFDNSRSYGAIAHELQEILPYAVSGEKDEMEKDGTIKSQGVDYSKLVPILVKAIQEMNTKLDAQNQTIQNLQEQINILAK